MQFAIDRARPLIALAINTPAGPCHAIAATLCISSAVSLCVIPALPPSINYYYKSKPAPSRSLF